MADYDAIVCGGAPTGSPPPSAWPRPAGRCACWRPTTTSAGRPGPWRAPCRGSSTTSGPPSSRWWRRRPRSSGATWPPTACASCTPSCRPPTLPRQPGDRPWPVGGETAASIDKVHLGDGAAWFALDEAFGEVMKHFLRAQMQRWPFEELLKVAGGCACRAGSSSPAWSSPGSAPSPTASSRSRPRRSSPARPCTPTSSPRSRAPASTPCCCPCSASALRRWWRAAPARSAVASPPRRATTGSRSPPGAGSTGSWSSRAGRWPSRPAATR